MLEFWKRKEKRVALEVREVGSRLSKSQAAQCSCGAMTAGRSVSVRNSARQLSKWRLCTCCDARACPHLSRRLYGLDACLLSFWLTRPARNPKLSGLLGHGVVRSARICLSLSTSSAPTSTAIIPTNGRCPSATSSGAWSALRAVSEAKQAPRT